jgi:hypothetical protein
MSPQSARQSRRGPVHDRAGDGVGVSDEILVLRNYDGQTTHDVRVTFLDAHDDVALQREYTVAPLGVTSVARRLERGVYRVTATVDGEHVARADCLVGSGPHETAIVEVGNGVVSLSEGGR